MKTKTYQHVLEMDDESTVISQFGWLPLSVFKPKKSLEWKGIIGDSGDHETRRSETAKYLPGLRFSEFNPEVAETVIRYWSLEGNMVVDPFAGRATRGIVALQWKRRYQGYEVAPHTFAEVAPKIVECGGTLECFSGCVMAHSPNESADLIFTCPPYHQLERYEPAPDQLSEIKDYREFLAWHRSVCEELPASSKAGQVSLLGLCGLAG